MNNIIAYANRTNKSLAEWQAYAEKREKALVDLAAKHRRSGKALTSKSGATGGQAKLKELALKELERLDPSNKLLDPAYRKSI